MLTHTAFRICYLVVFYLVGSTIAVCEGPYLNLCNFYENELNITEIEESAETICDCQQMGFCYLVELSQECESTVVILSVDENVTLSNLQCEILPLVSGMRTPTYEIINQTVIDIAMRILTDSGFGKFKISCSIFEILEEFNTTANNEWEILSVDPVEVTIDDEVELQLTLITQIINPTSVWCFLKTPDNTTEVLTTVWLSDSRINCMGFKPVTAGMFQATLNSAITSNMFDKSINVYVASKRPIAEKAEYGLDFETISVYFDENIELHSNCVDVFSKQDIKSFGRDFECFIRANALVVKMGNEFQIIDNVSISSENKLCRAGSSLDICLPAQSVNLALSKPTLLGPTLGLYMNPACENSQKYINVKLTPSKNSKYITQNQTLQPRTSGKTQRKNLIMWRTMRKIQSKFSSPLVVSQSNTTEVLSLLENYSLLDDLDVGQNNLGSVSVSVFVQSSPTSSTIVAEANVTFCAEPVKLYRFRWIVNREEVFESGRVLIVEDLAPGKYVIKCLVVDTSSNEILGEGWTTTEIFPSNQKVIITPSEITAGATDNITLYAVSWPGKSIFWSCKTLLGKLCVTTNEKLASEVLDLTSSNVSIPAGTFPPGDYIWSVENGEGANTAKVFIKSQNRITFSVEVPTFVKPSEEVVLRGSVRNAQPNCRAWWSSVREKGFNYLSLDNIKEEVSKSFPLDEIDLVIPPPLESVESMFMFKLQVFCPPGVNNQNGSLDYIKVPLGVNNPPRVSTIIAEPLEGFAMITDFTVSGGETDVSESLVFEWSYVDSCDGEIPIKRGAFGRSFKTYLPPGDIKLKLKVCNELGICSTTTTPTINVTQESEFPAGNFQKAQEQIEFLISSGDTLEAFGLAVTVMKSLALIHEPELREFIFSTVGDAIRAKIKDLTRRLESDSKSAKSSLEFYDRATTVAKYFRKGSEILVELTEFKRRIMDSEKLKKSF